MDVNDILEILLQKAKNDQALRKRLLSTQFSEKPYDDFCAAARENGCELYPMQLYLAGEEFYAAIKRSTNGGGENSPKLEGEDDLYQMFLAQLEYLHS
ncbi:MAG: hypothetical protein ACOX71_06225 [Lachnospiraceae bacterium]|jgi:hypothetical protein